MESSQFAEVKIEKIVFGGSGLARIDGQVCFVSDVIPGEKVLVRIASRRKKFLQGEAVKIIEPSPHRVEPECRYTSECGGCQYQHMTYEEELRVKESQVRETLTRALSVKDLPIQPIQFHKNPWHYRNHVTLHAAEQRDSKRFRLGFVGRNNVSIISVEECKIASEGLKPVLNSALAPSSRTERISFWLTHAGQIISDEVGSLFCVELGGKSFWAHTRGFFQNHPAVAGKLAAWVKSWVRKTKAKRIIDLYAGVGVFGIFAGESLRERVFFEGSGPSLEALHENLKQHHFEKDLVMPGRVEEVFPDYAKQQSFRDSIVVMDPPRAGLDSGFADWLGQRRDIPTLLYISCDMAVLARDLKLILAAGNFQVVEIVPFDMFPRTKHVEVGVVLKKEEEGRKGKKGEE